MPQEKEKTAETVKEQIPQEERKTNKERLKEITDGIEAGIKEVFESENYKNYLSTMSQFHNYSLNNTMLIYMQKPDATLVAGFNKWKDKFGRTVKQGEHGIKIIAPTPYKKKIEQEKVDPETKAVIIGKDGKPVIETKTVTIPMYKPVTVFDVSQTYGRELPQLAATLKGNVKDYEHFKEAVMKSAPVPMKFVPLKDNTDGQFSRDNQSISIREGMSEVQTVCAMIHETAHSMMHNYKPGEVPKEQKFEEIEAESVAYSVCKYFGIDTDANSFGYLASWSQGKDISELKGYLENINETASTLINSIEKNYRAITREVTKETEEKATETVADSQAPAPEKNAPVEPEIQNMKMPDPTVSVADMQEYGYTDDNMLPLSKERAAELIEAGCEVYLLYDDGTEGLATDKDDVLSHYGYSGIERDEWIRMSDTVEAFDAVRDKEKQFLENPKPCYAVYMLKDTPENRAIRYEGSDVLEKMHMPVDKENYEFVYSGSLIGKDGNTENMLSQIYNELNTEKPVDYENRSLSVSDIVALNTNGNVSYYYVDSAGFKDIPGFDKNPLKAAEMSMEDDADMIDGVINNGVKKETEAVKTVAAAKSEKKPSVLKKLNEKKAEIAANPITEAKEKAERSL